MAGGNKSNSLKSKKRKVQAQAAAVKAAQEKKSRWPNRPGSSSGRDN
jgi:hypothetical protein